MALSRILPDFGMGAIASPGLAQETSLLEDQKLASYETGYQAGWDDSASANTEAGNQISADFAQNMRDLSMTYQEAYAGLLRDVQPLLTQIVDVVLPVMAQDTLTPRLVALIEKQMSKSPRRALVLSTSPSGLEFLQPMVDGLDDGLDVELRSDDTLASGQVHLNFGTDHEEELDTTALIEAIQNAVHGFFEMSAAEMSAENAPQTEKTKGTA
ncbi:MAG: hypothetical protein AAFY25_04385 [Pseudomonadota bacterium]